MKMVSLRFCYKTLFWNIFWRHHRALPSSCNNNAADSTFCCHNLHKMWHEKPIITTFHTFPPLCSLLFYSQNEREKIAGKNMFRGTNRTQHTPDSLTCTAIYTSSEWQEGVHIFWIESRRNILKMIFWKWTKASIFMRENVDFSCVLSSITFGD